MDNSTLLSGLVKPNQNGLLQEEQDQNEDEYVSNLVAHWDDISNLCCNIAYFPEGDLTFIGHWRKNLTRPLILNVIYFLTFVVLLLDIFFYLPSTYIFYLSHSRPLL